MQTTARKLLDEYSHMGIDYFVKRNIRVLELVLYTGDFVQYFSFMKSAGCPFFSVLLYM